MPENRLVRPKSSQLLTSSVSAFVLVLLLFGLSWAQTTPSQPQANPTTQSPTSPGQAQTPKSTPPSAEKPEPQTRITKAQAKELFRSVDEILEFASHDTGLPIQHKVKRNLITRESVERYVDKRMKDDKDAQRLEQSRLVLEKFGLLPPGYDLHCGVSSPAGRAGGGLLRSQGRRASICSTGCSPTFRSRCWRTN